MLHKSRVLKALKGNARRQARILLGIKARPEAPVLAMTVRRIVERHAMICRRLTELWPPGFNLNGASVCEIGPGDCLAAAAFFLAKGAGHVDLVEHQPAAVNEKQREVLVELKNQGIPISLDVISDGTPPTLNNQLVTYHKHHMEIHAADNQCRFAFSHCVFEHVEDLDTVFQATFRTLCSGGRMLHIVDLGGHGMFEDPIPPLDFQTYPDWLYGWMYPVHQRATRRFLEDYRRSVEKAGFRDIKIIPLRTADETYVKSIRKNFRSAAQKQPIKDISVIEFALSALKE